MELPITHYEITIRDIIETIFGGLLVIFSLIGSIIFADLVLAPIIKKSTNKHINMILLFIHIIIILIFIMLIRYISKKTIQNTLILESIFSFFGPVISASSLYFFVNIRGIVNSSVAIII